MSEQKKPVVPMHYIEIHEAYWRNRKASMSIAKRARGKGVEGDLNSRQRPGKSCRNLVGHRR